jgi:transmembrane sensor
MEELDKLIQKFWDGQTTEPENIRLHHLLGNNADEILVDVSASENTSSESLPADRKDELLEALHDRLGFDTSERKIIKRPFGNGLRWHYWVAAASVFLILAGVFSVFRMKGDSKNRMSDAITIQKPALVNLVNSSDSVMSVVLKDKSSIRLSPRSAVTYYEPFVSARRDISLVGTAEFDIAKDSLRPFTVYTGRLSTTALGTKFIVHAESQNKFVKVTLLEGKVVLRSSKMQDVYLAPGQQCKFELESGVTSVSVLSRAGSTNEGKEFKKNGSEWPENRQMAFVQQPLQAVLKAVGKQFHVEIQTPDADINAISFTGTFFPSDSLGTVLSIICNANNLSFERKQNSVTIRKVHP